MTTFRHWLIRTIFLLPLLFCLLAWGSSRTRGLKIAYYHTGSYCECLSYNGALHLVWGHDTYPAATDGWHSAIWTDEFFFLPPNFWEVDFRRFSSNYFYQFSLLGFGSDLTFGGIHSDTGRVLHIPYYFLTLLASLALFYVWRKTRPQTTPASAFPVEPSKGAP